MLFLLREEGRFSGSMLGLDYRIASDKDLNEEIVFEVRDILGDLSKYPRFAIVLDKGTFDAVSLGQQGIEEKYVRNVASLVLVREVGCL